MRLPNGYAEIYDNRDGTLDNPRMPFPVGVADIEAEGSLASAIRSACNAAFRSADEECKHRNSREGWNRFVPLSCVPRWVRAS